MRSQSISIGMDEYLSTLMRSFVDVSLVKVLVFCGPSYCSCIRLLVLLVNVHNTCSVNAGNTRDVQKKIEEQ